MPSSSKTTTDVTRTAQANPPSDFLKRMLNGDIAKLTAEQIEHYVESRGRIALILIVASFLSGSGDKWLEEAAERFPDDPRVAAAMLIKRGNSPEASEWIARLKEHDPGNSLGYLLAAKSALDGNDLNGALKELSALESTRLNDHRETWQSGITEAYRSAVVQLTAVFNVVPFPVDASLVGNEVVKGENVLSVEPLAFSRSIRVGMDRDPATWQKVSNELRLPPSTEFLMVRMGMSNNTKLKDKRRDRFAGHFADNVQLVIARRPEIPVP